MDTFKQPKLSVSNISKTYRVRGGQAVQAVVDASFSVAENEICMVLGPSGCGKSTLLRMIAGLEVPSIGRMVLNGNTIVGPGRDRGIVFQSYTSFDWLTVQQNVEYGMRLNAVPKGERREKAAHFIDLVHLSDFRNAYPNQLSGGMKQRVAIARTLANDPNLLLMDEPFGALDAETRWSMQELLISIMEETATTVVMVTHDIEEAIFLADRILFMSRHPGRIREDIVTSFKSGTRVADKEAVISMAGYGEMERYIMGLMRQESPNRASDKDWREGGGSAAAPIS